MTRPLATPPQPEETAPEPRSLPLSAGASYGVHPLEAGERTWAAYWAAYVAGAA